MKLFRTTKSFKIVTLLEEINIKNAIKNIILVAFKIIAFNISTKIQIRSTNSISKKIELCTKLFKERFYLAEVTKDYNNIDHSIFNYTMIANNIVAEINYTITKFNIEYDIQFNECSIYITSNNRGFNITKQKLITNKELCEAFDTSLKLLQSDVILLMLHTFEHYLKKGYKFMYNFTSNDLIEAVLYNKSKVKSYIRYRMLLYKIRKISPDYKTLETIYDFIDQLNFAYFYCMDKNNHLFITESRESKNSNKNKSLTYKDDSVTIYLKLKPENTITLDIKRYMGYKQTSITFSNGDIKLNNRLEEQLFINCTDLIMNELYKTIKKYRYFRRIK